MNRGSSTRPGAVLSAAALALAGLASCAGPPAGGPPAVPTVVPTARWSADTTSDATAAPPPAPTPAGALAETLAVERAVGQRAALDGHAPSGSLTVAHRTAGTTWFLWSTQPGDLCVGSYTHGSSVTGCTPARDLPSGTSPALGSVYGPAMITDVQWLSLFVAEGEEVSGLSCDGVPLDVTEVSRTGPADRPRIVYSFTAPWMTNGTLHADTLRQRSPAADALLIPKPSGQQGDFMRTCS